MAATFLCGAGASNVNSALSRYMPAAYTGTTGVNATEANAQVTYRTGGVLSKLYYYISANTINATTTGRTRVNGADGAQSVSILTTATGVFEDGSNTDTIAAGDEVNYHLATGGSSGTITYNLVATHFAATSNTVTKHCAFNGGGSNLTFNSSTEYFSLGADAATVSAEDECDFDMNTDATHKNLFTYITANSRTTTCTTGSRKANGAGALAVSITAGATGVFEDTSNSDSISANDDVCYYQTHGASGGTLTRFMIASEVETTNNKFTSTFCSIFGTAQNFGTTNYVPFGGNFGLRATEALAQLKTYISVTASNLYVYLSANTVNADSTFDVREAAGSTAVTISLTASTTGAYEDASNTNTSVSGDLLNCRLATAGSSGAMTARPAALMFENTTAPPAAVTRVNAILTTNTMFWGY